ncbi:MAG: Abi-alpha family protein [Hyphomicrobiaceae bacterium]
MAKKRIKDKANPQAKADLEAAKAVRDVAKVAGDVIASTSAVGSFLHRVFGSVLEDAVGMVGDPLRAYRLRRLADLQKQTDAYLEEKGVSATDPISPRIGYKIMQEASLESDPDLAKKFARLLAEAMDPNGESITLAHVEAMNNLQSGDAQLLEYCWHHRNTYAHVMAAGGPIKYERLRADTLAVRSLHEVERKIGTTEDTIRRLMRLGLLKPSSDEYHVLPRGKSGLGELLIDERFERVTIYYDINIFEFTELGISFSKSVIAPIERKVGKASDIR